MATDKIIIQFDGDTSRLEKKIKDTVKEVNELEKVKTGDVLKKTAAIGAVAFAGLTAAITASVAAFREQEQAEIRTRKTIEATGGAAGLTAEQIFKMASELQGVTTFGDEAIISGQNLLLTFRNIGGDVFPRATEAMLDMSTAMGTDLQSSAIQLGKALNDPVAGISALTRVGITFTDEQKDQIKAMQESGDIAGAQAVILKELEMQFGGVSRAATEGTGSIIQTKNILGDLQEEVGRAAIPAVKVLNQQVLKLADSFQNNGFAMDAFKSALKGVLIIGANAKASFDALGSAIGITLAGSIEAASQALKGNFSQSAQIIKDTGSALADSITGTAERLDEDLRSIDEAFAEDQKTKSETRHQEAIATLARQADETTDIKIQKKFEENAALQEIEAQLAEENFQSEVERQNRINELTKQNLKKSFDAKRAVNQEDIKASLKENQLRQKEEVRYGKAVADARAFFRSQEAEASRLALDSLISLGQTGNKKLVAIAKAAALAKAIMNTAEGVTKALTFGPILGPPLAATIGAAGAVQIATIAGVKFADGGMITGGIPGKDSVPALVQRGEVIAPTQNFEEVIGSVRAQREAEKLRAEGQTQSAMEVIIGFTDDAFEIIEQKILERRVTGVGVI